MSKLSADTHIEMEKLQVELWRQATAARKMEMLAQLHHAARALALAGLKRRYADADQAELQRRLADLILGAELADRVYGPILDSQFARTIQPDFGLKTGETARFASPEDTILAKLAWYQLGGEASDRQWRDVLGILLTQAGELDMKYLDEWSSKLELAGLYERALEESK